MLPDEILKFFAKYIESQLGIVYSDTNHFQLQNRLEEIAKLLNVENIEQLYAKGKIGITGDFKQLLLDLATNNETSFFRDTRVFSAIEARAFPLWKEIYGPKSSVNIWSAASSSGQESLSLAMLLDDWNARHGTQLKPKITATDISERILNRAKTAKYSQLEVQRGLPAAKMVKYFRKEGEAWIASDKIRENIEFKKLNLKEPFSFREKFDLVLCRNVLIYQSVPGKKDILSRIVGTLAPRGILVLGAGESMLGLSDAFEQVQAEGVILYQLKKAAGVAA